MSLSISPNSNVPVGTASDELTGPFAAGTGLSDWFYGGSSPGVFAVRLRVTADEANFIDVTDDAAPSTGERRHLALPVDEILLCNPSPANLAPPQGLHVSLSGAGAAGKQYNATWEVYFLAPHLSAG